MKKVLSLVIICVFSVASYAQNIIQAGGGSYADNIPTAVEYDDGYFAAQAVWFQMAWPHLNLHDNVRNRPMPTNGWWTDFIFRGVGRSPGGVINDGNPGPVTVTTTGNRFGTEAWAYPHAVAASSSGFNVFYPKGFSGGEGQMVKGNALQINATPAIQEEGENILFADFEVATWATIPPAGQWRVTANSHNIPGPVVGDGTVNGFNGNRLISSRDGNNRLLTVISPKFTIEKKYIKLLVGGGNTPDLTYVGLFVDGVRVRNEYGVNSWNLTQRTWDVTEFIGREAEIRIVDNSTGSYGYILCDDIIFTDSPLGGAGYTADFQTTSAKIYDWSDLGFTLRSEDNGKTMDATIIHGVPFVYFELNGLYPLVAPGGAATVYNKSGQQVTEFPAVIDAFTVEYTDRVYGVHVPTGTTIHRSKAGDFQLETPAGKRYVVVSILPDRTFLSAYDQYARNKPGDVRFIPEYRVEQGKIVTTFQMNTKNLETGATNGQTLMSFLPHQWRNTTKNFTFISGADYRILKGMLHTAAGTSFEIAYPFGGMPPYMPEPLDLTPERKDMLNSILTWYAGQSAGFDGNTYAKGLGEKTTGMLMAKSMELPGFDEIRNNMKNQFADWLTFSESEKTQKSRYFVRYPNYGALIGFPPGYGSQGFNDLHFHNGYFTVGAARLMMVDKEFKRDYGEMVKLVTKTFANWDRAGVDDGTANYQPYLRTFDPYLGHSFAGGTGDGSGNNQESTSEAINSWFGVYMLGVELNDKAIIDAGATGYLLENIAQAEYWLDIYQENFPPTYTKQYVGILRNASMAWATYFSGDPSWILGIQACPADFYYRGFMLNPTRTNEILNAMFYDRTVNGAPWSPTADPYESIKEMGAYVGGYHLNILNNVDPVMAADFIERLCNEGGTSWRNHTNTAANYYNSNAMITYGSPAEGYHTSLPGGAVYKNAEGTLSYLLYNPTNSTVNVNIYKDGVVVDVVTVGAGKYYNSRVLGSKPNVSITTHKAGDKMAINKQVKVTASASDKDGRVLWVDFYFDGVKVGTSYVAPYEVFFTPTVSGIKELKAIAFDDDGQDSDPAIISIEVLATEQTPFLGTPWNVPAQTIIAVQFDNGGPEVSCHTNNWRESTYRPGMGIATEGTGNIANSNIGYSNVGMWMEYTIDVQTTGVYQMIARVGSRAGGALRVFIDGVDVTGAAPVPSGTDMGVTGLTMFDCNLAKIPLTQGKHIMRVMVERVPNGLNMNSFRFTLTTDAMPPEVDAGENQSIEYEKDGSNSVTLNATVKTYGGATVSKYEWKQFDTNRLANIGSPNSAETVVSGLEPGTYIFEVKVTDSNGAEAIGRVIVLVTGSMTPIRKVDIVDKVDINVFPNPFADQLIVSFGDNVGFKKLRITSITGKVVMEENIYNQTVVNLNTSALPKGHYVLTLYSDKEVISRKIIK